MVSPGSQRHRSERKKRGKSTLSWLELPMGRCAGDARRSQK